MRFPRTFTVITITVVIYLLALMYYPQKPVPTVVYGPQGAQQWKEMWSH